jgi:hypothetical protein
MTIPFVPLPEAVADEIERPVRVEPVMPAATFPEAVTALSDADDPTRMPLWFPEAVDDLIDAEVPPA